MECEVTGAERCEGLRCHMCSTKRVRALMMNEQEKNLFERLHITISRRSGTVCLIIQYSRDSLSKEQSDILKVYIAFNFQMIHRNVFVARGE